MFLFYHCKGSRLCKFETFKLWYDIFRYRTFHVLNAFCIPYPGFNIHVKLNNATNTEGKNEIWNDSGQNWTFRCRLATNDSRTVVFVLFSARRVLVNRKLYCTTSPRGIWWISGNIPVAWRSILRRVDEKWSPPRWTITSLPVEWPAARFRPARRLLLDLIYRVFAQAEFHSFLGSSPVVRGSGIRFANIARTFTVMNKYPRKYVIIRFKKKKYIYISRIIIFWGWHDCWDNNLRDLFVLFDELNSELNLFSLNVKFSNVTNDLISLTKLNFEETTF